MIIIIGGVDGAGKGETVNIPNEWMDPRHIVTHAFGEMSDEERERPRMWRFWRHLPRTGRVTIVDRSWYGRVLVERVEKFCSEDDWMRAYHEINDFEEQLVEAGGIVTKFWVTITKAEQLKRFREREKTPFKSFKITPDDWRKRKKWADYERAVCDMIERTSTKATPWVLIPANDKYYARIEILKTLCARLEAAL